MSDIDLRAWMRAYREHPDLRLALEARLHEAQAAYDRAARLNVSNEPPRFTVDDVRNARDLLKDYEGDVHGLFDGTVKEPERFTEWKLYATCPIHGEVTNTVSIPAYQTSPVAPHVVCGPCLTSGTRVHLKVALVVKITQEEGS